MVRELEIKVDEKNQTELSDNVLQHFFKVCILGVSYHRKLYEKYKRKFYDALICLVMSLSHHPTAF